MGEVSVKPEKRQAGRGHAPAASFCSSEYKRIGVIFPGGLTF